MPTEPKGQKRTRAEDSTTLESEKQKSKKRIQDLEGQLQDRWECMEAADDEIVAQQEANTIRRLSDVALLRNFQRSDDSEESCEFIDVGGVLSSSDSDEDDDDNYEEQKVFKTP